MSFKTREFLICNANLSTVFSVSLCCTSSCDLFLYIFFWPCLSSPSAFYVKIKFISWIYCFYLSLCLVYLFVKIHLLPVLSSHGAHCWYQQDGPRMKVDENRHLCFWETTLNVNSDSWWLRIGHFGLQGWINPSFLAIIWLMVCLKR